MSKIITIAGQKGGSGKSVTALNIAASLALYEKNTLLIDCDPLSCVTEWCGVKDLDYDCDLASALSGRVKFTEAIVKSPIDFLDVMPSCFELFKVALKLAKNPGNEKILRIFLKDVENEYEYIIIDSPSSYNFLSITAMTAADYLLVCMAKDNNSVGDFHSQLRMIEYIRDTHDVSLEIAGVLFNRYNAREDIEAFIESQDLPDAGQLALHAFIPEDEAIRKSAELNTPVALHDIKSPAALAYLEAAKEIHFSLK